MIPIPGGLFDSTRRPRRLQVVSYGDWYLAGAGLFAKVGFGELALADLEAVYADLGERVFLAHPQRRPLTDYLARGPEPGQGQRPRFGFRRVYSEEHRGMIERPSVAAVARGAQVAVLPGRGPVWVDDEHLFQPDERAPLPWTEPLVEMTVVRPKVVIAAIRRVIGPGGPTRVTPVEAG